MSTVLWGGRRGDVQYASREFWRSHLRLGVPTVTLAAGVRFDVGDAIEVGRTADRVVIDSREANVLAVRVIR